MSYSCGVGLGWRTLDWNSGVAKVLPRSGCAIAGDRLGFFATAAIGIDHTRSRRSPPIGSTLYGSTWPGDLGHNAPIEAVKRQTVGTVKLLVVRPKARF